MSSCLPVGGAAKGKGNGRGKFRERLTPADGKNNVVNFENSVQAGESEEQNEPIAATANMVARGDVPAVCRIPAETVREIEVNLMELFHNIDSEAGDSSSPVPFDWCLQQLELVRQCLLRLHFGQSQEVSGIRENLDGPSNSRSAKRRWRKKRLKEKLAGTV